MCNDLETDLPTTPAKPRAAKPRTPEGSGTAVGIGVGLTGFWVYWSENPLIKEFWVSRVHAEVTSMTFVPALNKPLTVEPVETKFRVAGVKFVAVSDLPKVAPSKALPWAFVPASANSLVKELHYPG